jgi:hypothetical protein
MKAKLLFAGCLLACRLTHLANAQDILKKANVKCQRQEWVL